MIDDEGNQLFQIITKIACFPHRFSRNFHLAVETLVSHFIWHENNGSRRLGTATQKEIAKAVEYLLRGEGKKRGL